MLKIINAYLYTLAILGYQLHSLFYYLANMVKERMYVSIHIGRDESGYEAIQQFIGTKTSQLKSLRDVEGRCIMEDDNNTNDMQGPSPPPKLQLFPCKSWLW